MKKKQARFRIFIFYILILAPAVVWGLLSLCGLSEKLDVNTGEKRDKHEMAADTTLASGMTVTGTLEARTVLQ